jgi:hypothetical protein
MPEDKNKRLSSDEDSRLFREFVGQVKTLPNTQQHNLASKEKPKPVKKTLSLTTPSVIYLFGLLVIFKPMNIFFLPVRAYKIKQSKN